MKASPPGGFIQVSSSSEVWALFLKFVVSLAIRIDILCGVTFPCQLDFILNHQRDTLLDVSVRVFKESFNREDTSQMSVALSHELGS